MTTNSLASCGGVVQITNNSTRQTFWFINASLTQVQFSETKAGAKNNSSMTTNPSTCRSQSLCLAGIGVLALIVNPVPVHADSVDFNNYTSPTDNDLVNQFNSVGGTMTQLPTGGITGGGVAANQFNRSSIYKQTFNPTDGLTTSIFFQYDNTLPGGLTESGWSARVGITRSPMLTLDPYPESAYFYGEFYNDGKLAIYSSTSDGRIWYNPVTPTSVPAHGNWMKLTFSEQYLGGGQFHLSTTLEDYGMSGLETPTLMGSASITVANPEAAADSTAYAGFNGYFHVRTFDNFAVVPEPSAWQLLAGAGAIAAFDQLGGSRLRRRGK